VTTAKNPSPRWRLFIAAPVPEPAAVALWLALEDLRAHHPGARWAKREQLHATLLFLGQTDPAEVPRLVEAMALTARQHGPFTATTTLAGGRFDDRRGGVAWLVLDDRQRRLRNLAREVDWRAGTNVYANSRPRPHVTVARRIDQQLLADLHAAADGLYASWTFDRMILYRSYAEPGGSRYEALAEQPLTAAVAAA
jgi:RNA 2',3'-cyclic 3'-phosphodiesterase